VPRITLPESTPEGRPQEQVTESSSDSQSRPESCSHESGSRSPAKVLIFISLCSAHLPTAWHGPELRRLGLNPEKYKCGWCQDTDNSQAKCMSTATVAQANFVVRQKTDSRT
ncbi:hypothetical protein AVEN_172691-1, partial [Araneus ventricosus]